jgi:hypothetical protein
MSYDVSERHDGLHNVWHGGVSMGWQIVHVTHTEADAWSFVREKRAEKWDAGARGDSASSVAGSSSCSRDDALPK